MDDNLFTYEVKILEPYYVPSVEQLYDNLKSGDRNIYEPRVCYDENEPIYAKVVILINKRLVRLIDITVEQWLDLKFDDHKLVDKEVKENVISTWLIRSYKKKFDKYIEIKKRLEVRGDDEGELTDNEIFDLEEDNLSG
ncbi:hypothetical protein Tco_1576275 [Tanacetum coccineum]